MVRLLDGGGGGGDSRDGGEWMNPPLDKHPFKVTVQYDAWYDFIALIGERLR